MTLISIVGQVALILDIIVLVLVFAQKKMSYVDKMLWVLQVLMAPLVGPVFFLIFLLVEKNRKEKAHPEHEMNK
jgi:hypothetical protein